MSVFNIRSLSGPSRWKAVFPLVWSNQIMTNWYIDCPVIFLHITLLIKFPFLPTGALFINSSLGGSVASASAPSVSIIMLTHKSWTAVRGAFPGYLYISWGKKNKAYNAKIHNLTLINMITRNTSWLPVKQAEVKLTIKATTFTVSWNCTNFCMFM